VGHFLEPHITVWNTLFALIQAPGYSSGVPSVRPWPSPSPGPSESGCSARAWAWYSPVRPPR
jgi:hypothetical protein